VVTRRQFLKQLGLGMVAGAAGLPLTSSPIFGTPCQDSPELPLRVALLADSHLPDANIKSGQASRLAAAVAEINAHNPRVDLVILAGDLTDNGDTETLWLGKEILASLHAPCWLVPGEKDYPADSNPMWEDIFGDSNFSFTHQGVHFCGLNTTVHNPATGRKFFQFSRPQYHRLARELGPISPEVPLLVISHAPLYRLFQPWQWWTEQAESLYDLLSPRENVFLFHGHVHQNITLQHQNLTFQGLRSTAWPLPDVRVGFKTLQPPPREIGNPTGCGWMLLTINGKGDMIIKDQV
jgi:Icc protein